ncbi:MAG: hypothetical protein AUI64_02205 [Acidobacteria bacterium 13_1_40CM_2_64_6]|nr:MAG: hypothetical protein AUI64_02205 [Acidobacteria bacterium 13_1_40CM_2_64_6]
MRHQARQEVGRRDEVGVEDADERTARRFEAGFERAGFEPDAIGPVVVLDVDALRGKPADGGLGDAARLVNSR